MSSEEQDVFMVDKSGGVAMRIGPELLLQGVTREPVQRVRNRAGWSGLGGIRGRDIKALDL
ncbi:hypothetical protein [Paraburkholderia sp. DHOC27]|uniref:hypothetical protein n=1 Tax=Paraburkholderia sp. DHOC27 TaxID=2303330 RepID=UPI000E3E6C13|nr:hypothetical protein [Paraburkholderia sp. DHOC27]RFU46828.1 hypothetical protein D0B32_17745 [Paraburkholderia sp. DHOC27]